MLLLKKLVQKCTTFTLMKQLQSHLTTTGRLNTPFCSIRSKLIEHLALSTHIQLHHHAKSLFLHLPNPSTNDFNAILRGLAASSQPSAAISWFHNMICECQPTDALTCSFTLKACARALAKFEALEVHSHVLRSGFLADALLGTTLLDVYAKAGDLDSARKVFDEMSVRDIASWNALISGLANGNFANEAIELFYRMKEEGSFKPNEVTVLGALAACSHLGAIKEGEKVYEYIRDEKLDMNVIVCNAVIDMYAKCGSVDKAFAVFDRVKCWKNVVTWNTMMMGYAMHGDGSRVLEFFEQMGRNYVKPDDVTYLAVLCGCNHSGLVDDGVRLFNSMAENGVKRNMKHYGSMVDLLGRNGRLKEAYDIITSMPMVPDMVLWQTLLGASQLYGNIEMAEIISRKLMEMGSTNCGDFVLLSNVYAARERWKDVGRVRDTMKNREVKKVPAFSYIEVDGVITKFFSGDKSHEKWKEIYDKMDEIRFKIKEHGYVADTGYVLHDIGEEEKENALCYHSEKLAVAFGLISTSEGSSIQVFKNLRICGDCHFVIKLISKIYKREIIVRDRVRFHRFVQGSCSCKEYW